MLAQIVLTLFVWWLGPILVLALLYIWGRAGRQRRRRDEERYDRTRYP